MSQHRPPIAVFDLDGTLADTIHDLIATLNVVLDRRGPAAPAARGGPRDDRRRRARPDRARPCGSRPRGHAGPARRPVPRFPRPLRRAPVRRDEALPGRASRRSTGSRTPASASPSAPTSSRPIRSQLLAGARRRASLRGDLRARQLSLLQAGPAPPDADHREGRRRPGPGRHGRRFAHRHRHRAGGRRSRSSRSPSATRTSRSRDLGPDRIIDHFDELLGGAVAPEEAA